jgi:hypothetical protein
MQRPKRPKQKRPLCIVQALVALHMQAPEFAKVPFVIEQASRTKVQMHVFDAEQTEVDSTSRFKDKSPFVPVTILALSSLKMPHPAATPCVKF